MSKEPGQLWAEQIGLAWDILDEAERAQCAAREAAIRNAALEEAAKVAELAPYKRGKLICGCSEGLADWTAAAIRALSPSRPEPPGETPSV